jgi:hypothetical protein
MVALKERRLLTYTPQQAGHWYLGCTHNVEGRIGLICDTVSCKRTTAKVV